MKIKSYNIIVIFSTFLVGISLIFYLVIKNNRLKEEESSFLKKISEKEKIVILYKDRLIRFGYELIENICNKYGTKIEIIDSTERIEEQELVEDLVQIVTVFSCRLQGKRANRKLVE